MHGGSAGLQAPVATSAQKRESTSCSRSQLRQSPKMWVTVHLLYWHGSDCQDGFTFLNHGAFGATLKSCLESKRLWAEHIEKQPVRFLDRALLALVEVEILSLKMLQPAGSLLLRRAFPLAGLRYPKLEPGLGLIGTEAAS